MRWIIEFDGVVVDVWPARYRLYREIATEIGWSCLDQATYRRLTRKNGREAVILPAAKPTKISQFHALFDERIEGANALTSCEPQSNIRDHLGVLKGAGPCVIVTLGSNRDARRGLLDRDSLSDLCDPFEALAPDPRRRPTELRALADGDPRTVVVGATDSLIRAAGQVELFTVGIAQGSCSVARLHQAGADLVYPTLEGLVDSVQDGSTELIAAGLLPPSLG